MTKIDSHSNYMIGQAASGIEAGDTVRVLRKAEDKEMGWVCIWPPKMDKLVGREVIVDMINANGISLRDSGYAPYFILQIVTKGKGNTKTGTCSEALDNLPNFIIDCGEDIKLRPILSEMVQKAIFAAGYGWNPNLKEVRNIHERLLVLYRQNGKSGNRGLWYNPDDLSLPTYSAATQMGEILRILTTPVKPALPVAPELYGYTAEYRKGYSTIKLGCAEIGLLILHSAKTMIEASYLGNRGVQSITLDSGKVLDRKAINSLLDYVAAVNKAS